MIDEIINVQDGPFAGQRARVLHREPWGKDEREWILYTRIGVSTYLYLHADGTEVVF